MYVHVCTCMYNVTGHHGRYTLFGMPSRQRPLLCLQASSPRRVALTAFPLLYGSSVATVLALVLLKAQLTAAWPLWLLAALSLAAAVSVATAVHLFVVPGLQSSSPGEFYETKLVDLTPASSLAEGSQHAGRLSSL